MILSADLQYFTSINSMIDIANASSVLFDRKSLFKKSSFRNRMMLAGPKGQVLLSIPIIGGRNIKVPYGEVRIDYKTDWQKNHYRTIETLYGKSPWFDQYQPELKILFESRFDYLFEWNLTCFKWVIQKLNIKLTILDLPLPSIGLEKIVVKEDSYSPSNFSNIENKLLIKYPQVFEDRIGFLANLSTLDLLFNEGPFAKHKIESGIIK